MNKIKASGMFLAALCITAFGASQAALAYDYEDFVEDQLKAQRHALRHDRFYSYPQINSVVVPNVYSTPYVQPYGIYSQPTYTPYYGGRIGGAVSNFLYNLGL